MEVVDDAGGWRLSPPWHPMTFADHLQSLLDLAQLPQVTFFLKPKLTSS
jgi:hypothetical protein